MEVFTEFVSALSSLLDLIKEHSAFLAALGTFSICGQIAKEIFTKQKALKGKPQWFWWRMRQSLPLHPVLTGIVVGLFDKAHGVAYYAFAGVLSAFLFDLLKRYTGYTVDLPGDSLPPEGPT